MVTQDREKQLSSQLPTWARWMAFAVTVASLAIAGAGFIWGLRVEKRKRLDFVYLAKLSLVSPELRGQVGVTFEDRNINNLTKLSARVTNSGDIPIEKRDIEQPPTITFNPGISVLEAKITERNPNGVIVDIKVLGPKITELNPKGDQVESNTPEPNQIVIDHGLLNPGDSITFEVLLDGELSGWPEPTMRISGVQPSRARVPTDQLVTYSVAFFPMPRTLEYLTLVLGSIVGIGTFILSLIALPIMVKRLRLPGNLDEIFDQRIILGTLKRDPSATLDAPTVEKIREYLANYVYSRLQGPMDMIAKRAVESVSFSPHSNHTAAEFLKIARHAVEDTLRSTPLRKRVDTGELAIFVLFLLIGVTISLVMSGSWRMFLAA